MGLFDGLFGSSTKTTNGSTTTTNPAWVNQAGQQNYAALQRIVNKPYTPYKGTAVVGPSANEQAAWSAAGAGLQDAMGGGGYNEAADWIRQSMAGGASRIDDPTMLADEFQARAGDVYKSREEYMNPWVQAMLDPSVRAIRESGDLMRNNLAAEAVSAGAFGDMRHGIEEAMGYRDEAQNIGDLTANVYGTAFDKAGAERMNMINTLLGLQSQDVQNSMGADTTNAALAEQYRQRLLGGGAQLGNLETAQSQNQLDWLNAAAGAGQSQRGIQQAKADFDYQQFLEGRDWDQQSINALMAGLNGTTFDRKTITKGSSDGGSSGIGGLLGSVLGSWLG